jgi:hypothetical protein
MKTIILSLFLSLSLASATFAVEIAGVKLEPSVTVRNHSLKLNGYGLRKKFFVKVYIGSLYSSRRLATAADALRDSGDKLVRMNFLHSKVEKEKIIEAFSEGLGNNSPELAGSVEAKKFLSLFTADFHRGDVVDLALGADGTVSASHNNKLLGTIASPKLVRGVLAIYLGDKPADEDLKAGMLGRE